MMQAFLTPAQADAGYGERSETPKTHQCEVKASNNAKNIAIAKTRAGRQVTFAGK